VLPQLLQQILSIRIQHSTLSFALRATQRLFTTEVVTLHPIKMVQSISCANNRTLYLRLSIKCSSSWHVKVSSANCLVSHRMALRLSFRTLTLDFAHTALIIRGSLRVLSRTS